MAFSSVLSLFADSNVFISSQLSVDNVEVAGSNVASFCSSSRCRNPGMDSRSKNKNLHDWTVANFSASGGISGAGLEIGQRHAVDAALERGLAWGWT